MQCKLRNVLMLCVKEALRPKNEYIFVCVCVSTEMTICKTFKKTKTNSLTNYLKVHMTLFKTDQQIDIEPK